MTWVFDWLHADGFIEIYLKYVYGGPALLHIFVQYTFAISHKRYSARWERVMEAELKSGARKPVAAPLAVLVPIFNEGLKELRLTLEGLARQVYGGPMMVVLVDDGSYLKEIEQYSAKLWELRSQHSAQSEVQDTGWKKLLRRIPWVRTRSFCQVKVITYPRALEAVQAKRSAIVELCNSYERRFPGRFRFITGHANEGKRRAHMRGHAWVRANFHKIFGVHPFAYLTVDSDTALHELAAQKMVRALIERRLGAATGYVGIRNGHVNVLARMVEWRYWSAFFVERAAQSRLGCVMCCSGPLAIYRARVLDDEKNGVLDKYVNQFFMGVQCTYGDDRRMTALILEASYRVGFVPEATCLTDAPTTLEEYRRQQTRWNMSFLREALLTYASPRSLFSHSPYMVYDLTMQLVLPYLLMGSLGITVYLALFEQEWGMVAWYAGTVLAIGLLRSVYGAWERREPKYLLFAFYGFVYIWLLSVRLRAVFKLFKKDTGWQTRSAT